MKEAFFYMFDECNYACKYCMLGNPEFQPRESRTMTPAGTEEIIKFFTDRSDWHIYLSGGEPTVHPEFIRLAKEISRQNYLRIDSNGSMAGQQLEEFIREIDPARVDFMRYDLHTVDEEPGRLEEYIQRAKKLVDNGFKLYVEFVTTSDRVQKIPQYFEKFRENGIPFVVTPFRGREGVKYTQEEMANLDQYMISAVHRSITETGERKPLGKLCSAGYCRIQINGVTGRISRCWRDGETLGNIFENQLNLSTEPQPCDQESCTYAYQSHDDVHEMLSQDIERILSLPSRYDEEIYREYREKSV